MHRIESWQTLAGGVRFKKQNYYCSCFAAAYQNLMANLSPSRQHLCTGSYCGIEDVEQRYMLNRYQCDLSKKSPKTPYVNAFAHDYIDPLRCSTNSIRNDGSVTVDTLYRFYAQIPNRTTGYILNIGNTGRLHAWALFIKRINGEDRYVFLDGCGDYMPIDFPDYAQICERGRAGLEDLRLYDFRIHGGMMAIF